VHVHEADSKLNKLGILEILVDTADNLNVLGVETGDIRMVEYHLPIRMFFSTAPSMLPVILKQSTELGFQGYKQYPACCLKKITARVETGRYTKRLLNFL
jgi:hypothetical protein